MPAVVVLPLVAETTTEPRVSRDASSAIACGSMPHQHLARQARAPAAPRAPSQLADRSGGGDLDAEPAHAGTIT